tara:strand:+ start:710 stop:1459 length:750 start_codon:yes stop_codon:yes gene_type:complete
MGYNDSGKPEIIETDVSSSTHTRGRPSLAIVKSVLEATFNQQENISYIYRESLQAVKEMFGGLKYINADEGTIDIRCIHGNPERTIAKLKQDNNIILPIISIVQTSSEEDENRRRPRQIVLDKKVWSEARQRAFRVFSLAPKAVNLLYDVNVWSKYKSDLDQISEQMHLKFHPSIRIVTSYNKYSQGFLVQETDQSSVDLGDKEDRILRRSYSFKLQTYIPSPQFLLTSTGKIETFNTELELTKLINEC